MAGSEQDTIINSAMYVDGCRKDVASLEQVNETLQQPGHFIWLGLKDPNHATLQKIQKQFHLHDLAIEDALRAHQRPKVETYGDTAFIVLRTVLMRGKRLELGETHFFLGQNFLISIRHRSKTGYNNVRLRCESSPHLLKKGPAFALYAVMDFIVDEYFPVIQALEIEIEAIEEKILHERAARETTAGLYRLKRQLLDLKRATAPLIDICNRLMRFDNKLIDDETRHYFRDVYDHAVRINENVDIAREMLITAIDTNLSMIAIAQSEVGKKFAGWAAIIGVATLVVGTYGMNFEFMPELHWKWGYPLVMGGMVTVCLVMYWKFRKSGWL